MNQLILKDDKFKLVIGIVSILCSIGLLVVLITQFSIDDTGELVSVIVMFSLFSIGGIYICVHYFNYKVIISDSSLVVINIMRNKTIVKWGDIRLIDLNKYHSEFIIYTNKAKHEVKFDVYDFYYLLNLLEKYLDEDVFSGKILPLKHNNQP
jgi:hypothetical protein